MGHPPSVNERRREVKAMQIMQTQEAMPAAAMTKGN